jgi:hypothetical protein
VAKAFDIQAYPVEEHLGLLSVEGIDRKLVSAEPGYDIAVAK